MKKHSIQIRFYTLLVLLLSITFSNAQNKIQSPQMVKKTSPQASATVQQKPMTDQQETDQFINRLIADHLVNEANGFTVVKNQNTLLINGQKQTNDVAKKYLATIKQEEISVTVYPFTERLIHHPDAGIMQILQPIKFEAPCIVNTKKKPGC